MLLVLLLPKKTPAWSGKAESGTLVEVGEYIGFFHDDREGIFCTWLWRQTEVNDSGYGLPGGNSYIGIRGQDRDQVAVLIQEFNRIYLHINGAIRLVSKGYSKACATCWIARITFDEGDNAGLLTVLAN